MGCRREVAPRSGRTQEDSLGVAIDFGFHSLIQFLAVHENDKTILNEALEEAVVRRSLEFVKLLLENGAELSGIPFISVLRSWDPSLIQHFLDQGADEVTDQPFAVAFSEKIRTALRRFVAYRNAHPEFNRELQFQLDCALRFFSREGNLKWVSLLMWAGGDPRTLGSTLDENDELDYHVSALQEAISGGSIDVLKRLKLDPERDDLVGLLNDVAYGRDIELIRYLVEMGAISNDKQNGGSTALDRCIGIMHWEGAVYSRGTSKRTRWDLHRILDAIREFVRLGALWRPDDKDQLRWLRKTCWNLSRT